MTTNITIEFDTRKRAYQ